MLRTPALCLAVSLFGTLQSIYGGEMSEILRRRITAAQADLKQSDQDYRASLKPLKIAAPEANADDYTTLIKRQKTRLEKVARALENQPSLTAQQQANLTLKGNHTILQLLRRARDAHLSLPDPLGGIPPAGLPEPYAALVKTMNAEWIKAATLYQTGKPIPALRAREVARCAAAAIRFHLDDIDLNKQLDAGIKEWGDMAKDPDIAPRLKRLRAAVQRVKTHRQLQLETRQNNITLEAEQAIIERKMRQQEQHAETMNEVTERLMEEAWAEVERIEEAIEEKRNPDGDDDDDDDEPAEKKAKEKPIEAF